MILGGMKMDYYNNDNMSWSQNGVGQDYRTAQEGM